MEYHWIVPLIAAVANVFLAVVVDRRGPERTVSEVFTFLAVTLVFWNLIYVVFYSVDDLALAAELASGFRSGALFLFPAVFHLGVALPGRERPWPLRYTLYLDYALAVGFVLANAFGELVTGLRFVGWGYYSIGTGLYDLFSVYVILNFIGAFALLIFELRTSTEPRVRLQLKFWLFALVVSLPLGLTNLLPVYGVAIYPIGNLGSAAWAAVVAYAIVRHRLMDIEIAVTKGIAYLGVVLLLVVPATVASVGMQRWVFGRVDQDLAAGFFVLLLGVGLLFPLVRDWLERRVQRSFFVEKREARLMLSDFARSLLKILDKERISEALCAAVSAGFEPDRACVFVSDSGGTTLKCVESSGGEPVDDGFKADHPFAKWLVSEARTMLAEEAKADEIGLIEEVFKRNCWYACVPMVAADTLLGFVALGKKRNLDAFSVADLDALTGVAAQAAVALENARLYDELRRSQEIISRSDRLSALGTLAAGIAHEIRNPLVSIQTFFQLAPQRLDDEEFMSSFLKIAEGEVVRIRDLVGELLSYAKSTEPTIGLVDISELLHRVSILLLPHARNRAVELRCEVGDMHATVEADSDQLTQVFLNIALNAVHAAPEGGVVSILVEVGDGVPVGQCRVRVEDNGPGIPAELRDSIFNPFFTTKDSGTGLGLSIAHRIVSDYGGSIRVDDSFGGGAFDIFLPLAHEAGLSPVERLAV